MQEERFDVDSLYGRRADKRWNRLSVGDLFERNCWSFPDKEAIVGVTGAFASPENERLTYRQADALANRFAQALIARGLQRGDRVLMICENSVEAYVAKIGIVKAGGVSAPMNPNLAPDTKNHVLGLLQPRLAVVDRELFGANAALLKQHGITGAVIPIGAGDAQPAEGWLLYADFVAGMPDAEPDVSIAGDDIWQIIFTSGTTSWPKGAMMTHTAAYIAGYGHTLTHSRGVHCETDLRLCSLLPLIYHAADICDSLPAFLSGGTLIIGRKVGGAELAEVITRERVTAVWGGSPQFLSDLVRAVDANPLAYDLSCVTSVTWAWKSLTPGIAAGLRRLCADRVQLVGRLGQTEAIGTTRFWPEKWREQFQRHTPQRNYVGRPCPNVAAAIMDADGRLLDPETDKFIPGEIVYRSPTNMAGYYRNEEATRATFQGGWLHSGDSCEYDEDHMLVMVDRIKDLVKSGGENVSSIRVESVLLDHPHIAEAAVVGLPHARWGEAVTAFVILRPGAAACLEALDKHCRERLARFEVPKKILVVDDFPRTVGRKVLKFRLRQMHAALFEATDT